MEKIIKTQKSKEFEIHFIDKNGSIYAEVFQNGLYITPAEWPPRVSRHVTTVIEKLVSEVVQ